MSAEELAVPCVADFMTPNPLTVDGGLPLADALERMSLNNIRHLVVTENGRTIGVVSNRDVGLAAALPGVKLKKTPLSVAVRETPYHCSPEAPVDKVAEAMEANRYGCVLVAHNNIPVGIFTTTDALRALRQLATGRPAFPLSPSTHERDTTEPAHVRAAHHVRAADQVRSHGAGPSPNMGKIGGGPN